MAIVQRSEDALAQDVRCGGIEWATKRKPRKPILPKNNPRVSVPIPKGKDEKNARYIAVEPPQTKERAGSNPGLFYIPPGGCHFLKKASRRPTLSPLYTARLFFRVFFGCKQNASKKHTEKCIQVSINCRGAENEQRGLARFGIGAAVDQRLINNERTTRMYVEPVRNR